LGLTLGDDPLTPDRLTSAPAAMSHSRARLTLVALLAALGSACGDRDTDATPGDSAAQADSASAPFTGPVTSTPTAMPLAVADITLWESGMDAELDAVRESAATLQRATTPGDSAMAIIAMNEGNTRAAGATGAGVEESRYLFIHSTLSEAVANLVPLEQVMDVSAMPASMVAELRKNRETALAGMSTALPAEVMEALRARASALRTQQLALVAARLKSAGLGP